MERKPLEGIEALLFTLGAGTGYVLKAQDYSWWVVILAVVVSAFIMSKIVSYLRGMNSKLTN